MQTVLPAATATEFWDVAGYAKQKEAASTMTADDLVDAALAGLDQGELVTIPTLHEGDDWTKWEADRRALAPPVRECQGRAALHVDRHDRPVSPANP